MAAEGWSQPEAASAMSSVPVSNRAQAPSSESAARGSKPVRNRYASDMRRTHRRLRSLNIIDASMYCYHAIVVEECVYDRAEASHALNLFDMDQKYAEVKGIEEVLAWLSPSHAAQS